MDDIQKNHNFLKNDKNNLAPSAIFVKEHVLNKFYSQAKEQGLVESANQIIATPGTGNDTDSLEFAIACQNIAQTEIEKVDFEAESPENKIKKQNAWSNFTSNLLKTVKHKQA